MSTYLQHNPVLKYVTSDNATVFRSKEMQSFLKRMNIIHPSSAVYQSRSRAYVERANGLLQKVLISLTTNNDSKATWIDVLPLAVYLLNNKPFFGEVMTAAQLHHGTTHLRHDLFRNTQRELFNQVIPTEFAKFDEKFENVVVQEESEMIKRRNALKEYNMKSANKHKVGTTLKPGQYAVLRDRYQAIGTSSKLKEVYTKIIYKIDHVLNYSASLTSLLDGTTTVRPFMDIKSIDLSPSDDFDSIDEKIFKTMSILTADNIIEFFSHHVQQQNKPVTRATAAALDTDIDILENDVMFLEDDELLPNSVSFADT